MACTMFNGQIALVTGGGGGIGRAISQVLEREGAKVVVADIKLDLANETLNTLKDPSQHLAVEMNVTQKDSVLAGIAAALDKYKSPPTLVANGAALAKVGAFLALDLEQDNDIMDVNVKGTFLVNQLAVSAMMDHKSGGGSIVNISSVAGKVGQSMFSQYCSSKGAINSFTKCIAQELASNGIRVNAVLPGLVDTPMSKSLPAEVVDFSLKYLTPLGRMGKPEEIAEVVVFLLSERSSYMTGACVEVTGGLFM